MDLRQLGLTENESKVYEALLMTGKATAAQIAKQSHVPYGRIYTVLESLEAKGLVKVIPEETKHFVPSNPEELDTFIDEKKKTLDSLKEEIKRYKVLYHERKPEAVIIAHDKHNFLKLTKQMPMTKNYSYSIKYAFDYHPQFVQDTQRALKRGITNYCLGRVDKETIPNVKKWLKIYPRIKHIPNDGVAIGIIDDQEMIISLIKSNTIMLIKDKPFIDLMTTLFMRYYETEKELKL